MSRQSLVSLVLPANPTQPLEAATKQYVDNNTTNKQPLDADLTAIAGLTATTDNVIQSVGSAWASRTPAQLKTTLALTKTDVGLANVDNTSDANAPVSTAQAAADALRVLKAGDSMSGTLAIAGPGIPGDCLRLIGGGSATIDFWNPPLSIKYATILGGSAGFTFSISAVAKLTVANTVITSAVPIALPADPANALEAATKQYVDSKGGLSQATADTLYINVGGDTMTGMLTLPATNPSLADHAVRKGYVDFFFVQKAGDTMTGALTLPASDPTLPEHAVRKAYVDWWYLPKAGGTMTGDLTMNANIVLNAGMHLNVGGTITAKQINVDATTWVYAPNAPTVAGHLTNKAYVDARQPYTIWEGTQAAFDAIATLDANTYYYVVP